MSNHELPPLHPERCYVYCYCRNSLVNKVRVGYTRSLPIQFKSRFCLVHLLPYLLAILSYKKIILNGGSYKGFLKKEYPHLKGRLRASKA